MKKRRVAIMCELKERELQFLVILSRKLELEGFEVEIVPQRIFCGTRLMLFKPDIIIVNGLRSDSSLYRQVLFPKIRFGSTIISLYSEQIGRIDGIADTYNNPKILTNIDAHVVWGEGFASGLVNLGVPKEKIWILGSMALDLPFFIYDNIKLEKEAVAKRYGLKPNRKWILISDNIIRRADQIEVYEQIRHEFNSGIKTIAKNNNNIEVVFRPHPDNKIQDLKNIVKDFENYENIKIIQAGHNMIWSIMCDAMIVWRSTSSIEAWAANIETFALQTNENKFDYWHEEFMPNFVDAEELSRQLSDYLSGKYILNSEYANNRKNYINKWFHKIDGLSFDRIAYLTTSILPLSNTEIQAVAINWKEVVRSYYNEYQSVLAKLVKGEYLKFSVRKKDIKEKMRFVSGLETKNKTFKIHHGEYGNFMSIDTGGQIKS
jgi:hypothetical protein